MFSVGRHHSNKQNPSFLYVLTPDRTKLHDILEYSDYEKYNGMTHPWDKRDGDFGCFNFNYYLSDKEKMLIIDEINS